MFQLKALVLSTTLIAAIVVATGARANHAFARAEPVDTSEVLAVLISE